MTAPEKTTVTAAMYTEFFDQARVASGFVSALLKEKGYDAGQLERLDWKAYKETQYNKLAEIIRESLDMEYIYQILGKGTRMP